MNIYQIKAGTTDVSFVIRIIDSTDGTPETGVVYNTSGIDLEYRRELAASTDITEATLAALTTAHADGGFLHIGNGYYRLDLPDAAVAAGATGVLVHGTVTGMVVIGCYIQLVAYDPFDTVRLGLTALPNAAAEASGGLYTRGTGAGQINQANNGQIDANAARTGGTTNTGRDIGASVLLSSGTGTGQLSLSSGLVTLAGVTHTGAVIPTVTTLTGHTAQTGDAYARLGAPAGASVSADVAAVKADTAATLVDTAEIGAAGAGLTVLATAANLATVAGYLDTEIAAILADTNELQTDWANGGRLDLILDARASQTSVDDLPTNAELATSQAAADDATLAAIAALTIPSAATIADAVWDEALSGHAVSGSTGEALGAAGGAGDPWITSLPGAYSSGQAGYILGTNLNATVSSRASQTSLDTVDDFLDTEIAAIKAKTDNLPSDPADASDIASSFTTVNTKLDTIDDFLDTEVAAIKTKTDYLPSATAGAAGGLFIAGTNAATTITTALTTTFTGNLTGSVGSVTGAVGSVTGAVGSVTGNVGGNVTGSVGSVATGGIVEASFATTAGSFSPLGIVDQGTAQSATGTTLVLRSAAAFADDDMIGNIIVITGGSAGVGQARAITDYVGSTDTATVDTWATTPSGTITYKILADKTAASGSGLDAAGVRAAIGMASANLDTQLDALPTAAENTTAVWAAGTRSLTVLDEDSTTLDLDATIRAAVGMSSANLDTQLTAIDDLLDTEVAAIKAKTDSLTFTVAGNVDANIQYVNDTAVTGDGSPGTEWGS